jgi:hypothetical protein
MLAYTVLCISSASASMGAVCIQHGTFRFLECAMSHCYSFLMNKVKIKYTSFDQNGL